MPSHPLLRPVAWGAHLLALVLVTAAVLLGLWQMGSWQEQRSDAAAERAELPPVPLAEAMGPDEPFQKDQVGRPVTVSGTWVPEGSVAVSDRRQDGETGYWAVTPVSVSAPESSTGGQAALLVVRGWVADLEALPPAPEGDAELSGWLQPPEGAAGVTDEDRTDDVIPQLRIADAIQHVDQDLYGAFLVLDHDGAAGPVVDGLVPADLAQLPDAARSTGLRNLLYGIEWWVFAAFAAFIWWRWCADEVARGRVAEDG
ncbi:SURF1 family protein [Nocardioides solisilvae]|uniref:SURF1 family protein n=1 Tax=Nocardioides solisilvae TaxID=1542435 RepID=UPI000D7416D0|nr:SURF1 family protein [Nocardioides solisilvae]